MRIRHPRTNHNSGTGLLGERDKFWNRRRIVLPVGVEKNSVACRRLAEII